MSRVAARVVKPERPVGWKLGLKRMVVCSACLISLLVALDACTGASTKGAAAIDDRAIVARIRALISDDPSLSSGVVRVFAQEGNVTLSGTVPDRDSKARLLKQARSIEGVKSVSDNLELPR